LIKSFVNADVDPFKPYYNIYTYEFQLFWLYVPSACGMFFFAFADLLQPY
jgi:hypothetical protein